ncbi:serine/threonine-protein kinase SRPK3 [Ustulina deusta]|nr:serine/threonine-protein kinase SRPK3 [Ustulina deusta]
MFFSRRKKGDKWVLYRLLAKESSSESNSQSKYVALKIQAASVDVTNELRIQQHLAISFSKDSSSHFFLLRVSTPRNNRILRNVLLRLRFLHHNDVDPIVLEPLIEGGLQDQEVVKLADLGGAFQINTPPASLVAPVSFRTPDAILLTKSTITGPLPRRIRDAGPRYTSPWPNGECLDARPSDFGDSEIHPTSLEDAFFKYKSNDITDEKARELSSLLRKILQIESSKRPSAAELLGKQWFRM